MRVALYPFAVSEEPQRNLELVRRALEQAAHEGAELLVLPELWISSFVGDADAIAARAAEDERLVAGMQAEAAPLGVSFIGSALAVGTRAPRNRAHLAGAGGVQMLGDKAHLFRLTGEHLAFERGSAAPGAAAVGTTRVGAAICYDLRFPEVVRASWRAGAEIVCCVAQWGLPRTRHLRALTLGRAVELQGYVLTVNRSGQATLGRSVVHYGGEALVASPDGEFLPSHTTALGLHLVTLDLELARTRRAEVPVQRDDQARVW